MNLGKTAVIIPTLNEGEGIGPTIREIQKALENPEIIVVDAHSTDGTREIAARLGAKVMTQIGRGKGSALAQALGHVSKGTSWLVLTDGDYTYPFTFVPFMIKLLTKEPEVAMVTGNKSAKPETLLAHLRKLLTNRFYLEDQVFVLMHHLLNGASMKDPFTGLRVIRYEAIRDFQPKAERFDIEVEINHFICRTKGQRVVEVPIGLRSRLGGSKYGFSHSFAILYRMVAMALEDILP